MKRERFFSIFLEESNMVVVLDMPSAVLDIESSTDATGFTIKPLCIFLIILLYQLL